jgi:predicted HTH transcriptional regulator
MPSEFEKLIKIGESRSLELKEKLPDSDAIAKTAIAFSNGAGGKIILGVNDKTRKVVGLSDYEISRYPDRISNIIYDIGGYLLVGRDRTKIPQSAVQCARFKGKTTDVFVDRKEFNGSLFSQVEETMNFLKNNIELGGRIEGIHRKDSYAIPIEALREAVINAVVHRDYSISGAQESTK